MKVDRTPYQPTLAQFPVVDPVKVQRELDLRERAKARGKENQPAKDQESFDETELDVVTRFQQFGNDALEALAANMEVYAGRLSYLDNAALLNDIESEFENAISDFKVGVVTDSNALFINKTNLIEVEGEYSNFRQKNKLDRAARYPSHQSVNFSIIALFAVVDTIANAVFFSSTHPGGWSGAVFESVFISFVNVIVGLGCGYFMFRGARSANLFVRTTGVVGAVLLLTLILVFNTFAAHYRDVFASIPPEIITSGRDVASLEAFKRFRAQLWQLNGFQSYLMVMVGTIVSLISAYEGYRLDDPYPNFGAVSRQRERRAKEYAEKKEWLLEGLRERKDDAMGAISYLSDEIQRREKEYATVLESRRNLIQRYNGLLEFLERSANQLLETYRAENRAARSDQAPGHFNQSWSPGWHRADVPNDPGMTDRKKASQTLIKKLGEARKGFLGAYDSAVEQYQRIDQIVSKEALEDARAKIF